MLALLYTATDIRKKIPEGVAYTIYAAAACAIWLKRLTAFSKQDKLTVHYFDTETLETKETEMYVDGFKAKLYKDTFYKGLWTVSFTLHEF